MSRDALEAAVLLDLDRGVGQAQRLRDRLDDARQHGLGRRGRLQPARQAGHGRRGIVPLAVEQPVDAALQPVPQRVEHDRHETGRDDAAPMPTWCAQERAGERDHRGVGAHDAGRERP